MKVITHVITGNAAEDVRSDDEGDDEEIEEEIKHASSPINDIRSGYEAEPLEEEVGVEALTFANRKATSVNGAVSVRRSKKQVNRASGISIPGHGDHKELLGRIGCDKPS